MYYKIYNDNEILDVISNPTYFFRSKTNAPIACEIDRAEGVLSGDKSRRWYINGWQKKPVKTELVRIVEITPQEYEQLLSAFVKTDETSVPTGEGTLPLSEITYKTLRQTKIDLLNKICAEKIIGGIDVILSDKNKYHFDLTIEDQINLLSLQKLVDDGEDFIPYHAKNSEAKMFSNEDMKNIISSASKHRIYHTTYVNALKNYVQNLKDLNSLAGIYYGMPIPEEYQTEAFKSLQKQ